jgi:glycosyltransferase involved in cell wall biosynthesis
MQSSVGIDMGVSVIISTYTEERLEDVKQCIASLKRQTLEPKEIILVLDPNERLLRFFKSRMPHDVKIVVSDTYGLSSARNKGVQRASGEIVAFVDDDATADKHWLENLTRNFADQSVMGVGGFIKPRWWRTRPKWFPEELYWLIGCSYKGGPQRRSEIRNPIGCNMSFRKAVFDRVGYFRSDVGRVGKTLTASEETDFSIRLLRSIPNSKIIYEPSAVVFHKVSEGRQKLIYLWKRSYSEGISKALISSGTNNVDVNNPRTLTTEDFYLKYLLRVSIPSRLKQIYRPENALQLLTLLVSTCAVVAGFLSVKLGGKK